MNAEFRCPFCPAREDVEDVEIIEKYIECPDCGRELSTRESVRRVKR